MRIGITCASPVEFPYYSGNVGQPDICSFCGNDQASRDQTLLTKYKVVLPICETCLSSGKKHTCARPRPGTARDAL